MQQAILSMINLHNGIREVDLALILLELILPQNFDPDEYHRIIYELVDSKEIKMFDYFETVVRHDGVHKIWKSIFFTKETEFILGSDWSTSDKMVRESKGDT